MKKNVLKLIVLSCCFAFNLHAQNKPVAKVYTHADTLRGTLTPERTWWDVQRYELAVTPDFNNKVLLGVMKLLIKW